MKYCITDIEHCMSGNKCLYDQEIKLCITSLTTMLTGTKMLHHWNWTLE